MLYRFPNPKSLLVFAPISRDWPCVWLRSHSFQKLKLISVTIFFFFLVSHLPLLVIVDGLFGSPSGKEKPSNVDRKELVNG